MNLCPHCLRTLVTRGTHAHCDHCRLSWEASLVPNVGAIHSEPSRQLHGEALDRAYHLRVVWPEIVGENVVDTCD